MLLEFKLSKLYQHWNKYKSWTKERTKLMMLESLEINGNICKLLIAYPSGILPPYDSLALKSLQDRKNCILAHEMLTQQLKSRIQWDVMGDANTKFFHSSASTHRNSNTIWALQNKSLEWVESDEQLKLMGLKHFDYIFKDNKRTNIVD